MSTLRRTIPTIALAALLAGCYSSGGEVGDAADGEAPRDADGEAPRDAAPDAIRDVDAETSDTCPAPQLWRRVEAEIGFLEDISDGPVMVGQSARLIARVPLGPAGCLERGRTLIERDDAERAVRVTIEAFENVDALGEECPAPSITDVPVVLSGLAAGVWQVIDGSAGVADPVSRAVEMIPCDGTCSCATPGILAEGADCELDCECWGDLACVGYRGISGDPYRSCERSCGDDRDCGSLGRCTDWEDGPTRVCRRLHEDACRSADDCPAGYGCDCGDGEVLCACVPMMPAEGPVCCRGDDCEAGQSCVEYFGAGGFPLTDCRVRCRGDLDCPRGAYCGMAFDGPQGVCIPGGWD